MKKHLGVDYDWGEDDQGLWCRASMKRYETTIWKQFEEVTGKELKDSVTPAAPGTTLTSGNVKEPVMEKEYRSIVGKSMFWNQKIALEVNNATRELSRFMKCPGEIHWKALEKYCAYIKSCPFEYLTYRAPKELRSVTYFDANFASNPEDRLSVTGVHETLDDAGPIYTTSQGQKTVSKLSTEAEYIAGSHAGDGMVFTTNWIGEVLGKDKIKRPGRLIGDNQPTLFLMNNLLVGQRTKHIDIKAHWIQGIIKDKTAKTEYIETEDNVADTDTKNLDQKSFLRHAKKKRGT